MELEYAKVSAVGDRNDNQDRAAVVVADAAAIMMVFDGMGGHSDGAMAAEVGLRAVQEMFTTSDLPIFDPQGFLFAALTHAHEQVVKLGAEIGVEYRPRATCAVCLIQEGGSFWAHIGDSRLYQMRNGEVIARSRDHSHVEVLIQEGAISEDEAVDHPMRNFVECCIGGDRVIPGMTVTGKKRLLPGDVLLACSDGLWTGSSDEDIAEIVTRGNESLADNLKAVSLKALSANAPYSDNTTGTAIRWLAAG